MLNLLGRFILAYYFLKLIVGAAIFVYYHFSAQYSLPWAIQVFLALIIIVLVIACIVARSAEGLIFAPLLYFVFLYFEISGLNTFQAELREGPIDFLFSGQSVVSGENIISMLCFSLVLYWNIRVSDNKALKRIGDLTRSVIVRRPKKRKPVE